MDILDTILKWAGKSGKSENPGQRLFPADKRPSLDNLAETIPARKAAAQQALSPVMDVLSMLVPGGVATQLATQLAIYSPEAEAAIRPGGRPDLNLTHESSLGGLLRILTGRSALSNPSQAITSNNIFPFAGPGNNAASIVMNPTASHYFDPKVNRTAQLTNRDAFVTRQRTLLPPEFRLPSPETLRATEGIESTKFSDFLKSHYTGLTDQHLLSIMASPEFSSLKEFERSRYGARILDPKSGISAKTVDEELAKRFPDIMETLATSPKTDKLLDAQFTIDSMLRRAKTGDKEANVFLDLVRSAYADYAELKLPGELPLNKHTVSAILFPGQDVSDVAMQQRSVITDYAKKLGISAGSPKELLPGQARPLYEDLAKAIQKETKEFTPKYRDWQDKVNDAMDTVGEVEALKQSKLTKPTRPLSDLYFPEGLSLDPDLNTQDILAAITKYSPKFASDVASMYTSKSVDLLNSILKGNP